MPVSNRRPVLHPVVMKAIGHLRRFARHHFNFATEEYSLERREAAAKDIWDYANMVETVSEHKVAVAVHVE